jgi:hypothetical protein
MRWAVRTINGLDRDNEGKVDFVVFTGDIGLEMVQQTVLEPDINGRGSFRRTSPGKMPMDSAVDELAAIIRECNVKTWLFVPGNNDVWSVERPLSVAPKDRKPAERPENTGVYHQYIAMLRQALRSDYDIRDLGPQDATAGDATFLCNDFLFIGFDNSSFKKTWDEPGSSPNLLGPYHPQLDCVRRLEALIGDRKDKNIVFCHIPYTDDPWLDGQKAWTPSWNVQPNVVQAWTDLVKPGGSVAHVFSGHYHASDQKVYEDVSRWHATPGPGEPVHGTYVGLDKLTVCPPIAVKLQVGKAPKDWARGFLDVKINGAGGIAKKVHWYEGTGGEPRVPPTPGDPPSKDKCCPNACTSVAVVAAGAGASVLAVVMWWGLWQARIARHARKFCGTWETMRFDGRKLVPADVKGTTTISPERKWWHPFSQPGDLRYTGEYFDAQLQKSVQLVGTVRVDPASLSRAVVDMRRIGDEQEYAVNEYVLMGNGDILVLPVIQDQRARIVRDEGEEDIIEFAPDHARHVLRRQGLPLSAIRSSSGA